jgi:hypothetical protein
MVVPLKQATSKAHPAKILAADTTQVPGPLQVDEDIRGPSDGTGIVVGDPGASASTGSAIQIESFTTTERDNLVAANGMIIYNTTLAAFQLRQNSAWVTLTSGSGAARLFDNTATITDINTALSDSSVAIVYLATGTYSFTSTALTVPAGKKLVGSYRYSDSAAATGRVRVEFSGNPTGGAVQVFEGGQVEGLSVVKTGTLGTVSGVETKSAGTERSAQIIAMTATNWAQGFRLSTTPDEASSVTLRDCLAHANTNGFDIASATAAAERVYVRLEGCIARSNTSVGFLIAVNMSTGDGGTLHVVNCESKSNTSHGFNCTAFGTGTTGGLARSWFTNNLALANGGDGIRFPSGSNPTATISGNRSEENTGFGFLFAGAVGSTHKIVLGSSNISISNTAGDWSFGNAADEIRGIGSLHSEDLLGHGTVYVNGGTIDVTTLQEILDNDDVHTVQIADMGPAGSAAIDLGTAATGLTVPAGKRMIGAGNISEGTSLPRAGLVRFIYQGTGIGITTEAGAFLKGIAIEQTGTAGTGTGITCGAANGCTIEQCEARDFATGITTSTGTSGTNVRDCRAINNTTGFIQDQNVTTDAFLMIDNCLASGGTTGFDIDGPGGAGHVLVRGCRAVGCAGDGFNQRNAWGSGTSTTEGGVELRDCRADECGGHGFDLSGFAHAGTMVTGCRAQGCTSTGFFCALGDTDGERRPFIGNCYACDNGTEFDVDGTWTKGHLARNKPEAGTLTNLVPDSTITRIATATAINLRATSITTMYTAKTSEVVYVTSIVIRNRAHTGAFSTDPVVRVNGQGGTANIYPATSALLAVGSDANQFVHFSTSAGFGSGGRIQAVTATNTVEFEVSTAATGGTTLTADVEIWGYIAPV